MQQTNKQYCQLKLEQMIHGGFALGHLPDGQIALVKGALPQEEVIAELSKRSGVLQGHVTKVLTAHKDRVKIPSHPGLNFGFINYNRQLKLKREVIIDALKRNLKQEFNVPEVIAAPDIWHYRHAVQAAATQNGLGYRQPQSHKVIALPKDPTAHKSINYFWQHCKNELTYKGIKEVAFRCNTEGEVIICLLATASAKNYLSLAHKLLKNGFKGVSYSHFSDKGRFRGKLERLAGVRNLKQKLGRFVVTVNSLSFSQPNPKAASLLLEKLKNWLEEFDLYGKFAVDLYTGSGIIALYLSENFEQIIACDIDAGNLAKGKQESASLGINNINFIKANIKKLTDLPTTELIAVNPPRAGLAKPVRQTIIANSTKHIIYISCDIATWTRDVAHFETAGFKLIKLQPYDFYPHTHHIEILSLLSRS